jgi:hypothetical protein
MADDKIALEQVIQELEEALTNALCLARSVTSPEDEISAAIISKAAKTLSRAKSYRDQGGR